MLKKAKLIIPGAIVLTILLAIFLMKPSNTPESDPASSIIMHTDRAIAAFRAGDFALYSTEIQNARALSHVEKLVLGKSEVSVSDGTCDESTAQNYYQWVSNLLSPLAAAYRRGMVNESVLEHDAVRLANVLKMVQSKGDGFSLSLRHEQENEKLCDQRFSGYFEKRRAFDRYVSQSIGDWVSDFGRIANIEVVSFADSVQAKREKVLASKERDAAARRLWMRLNDPNSWHGLTDEHKSYMLHSDDIEVRACTEAVVAGRVPEGVTMTEIIAACKAMLAR